MESDTEEADEPNDEADEPNDAPNDELPPNPRRYFNQQLVPVYRRVPFPVHQPFPQAADTAVPRNEYTRKLKYNGTAANASPFTGCKPRARWAHSLRTPTTPPANPMFANRFLALLDASEEDVADGGEDGEDGDPWSSSDPPSKRQKGCNGKAAKTTKTAKKQPTKEKKESTSKVFKRKNAVNGLLVTYKVRMWPTPDQTRELKRVFAASRHVKNWVNREVKSGRATNQSKIGLRNYFKEKGRDSVPEWATSDMSNTVFDNACFKVAEAYSNGKLAVRSGRITHFNVNYWSASHKTPSEAIKVDKKARPDGKQAASLFDHVTPLEVTKPRSSKHSEALLHLQKGFKPLGGIRIQDKSRIINALVAEGKMLKEDCKIMWDKRIRGFYFLYTREEPIPEDPDPEGLHKSVGALDGGVRGFQTVCNATTGAYGELVCGFKTRIHNRVEKIDDLHSRATRKREGKGVRTQDKRRKKRAQRRHDRVNARERRRRQGCQPQRRPAKRHRKVTRLNRKLRRERARQTQWVEAVHYDAINFLFKHVDGVINPVLRTSQMAPREGRVFGKPSTRAMLTMSHYTFNQRLNWKAKRLGTKTVIDDTGEPGTTRTCPNPGCGRWHTHLGGDHVFTCPHCGIVAGRDDVGARGNLLAAYGKAVGILADGTSNGGA